MAKYKLINSLVSINCIFTVLVMSCGIFQDRILSTSGKRWMDHVANVRDKCVPVLVSKPEVKRLLVSCRRRWVDNKKCFFKK